MKKMLSLLLVVMLALACMPAFAEEGRTGTALFPCDDRGYPDLGGVTLDMWCTTNSSMVDFITTYKDLKVVQKLMEDFNVDFSIRMAPVGEESSDFTRMIASKDLPDIIWDSGVHDYYPGGTTMSYEDGLAWDYTEYITPENTPNYWKFFMEDEYNSKYAIDDDGRNIALGARMSGSAECCTCMWGMMIRKDYLAQSGLEVPETIEEWTNMLAKFKEMGVKYPMLLNKSGYWKSRNAFSCAWNIDARNFFIDRNGEVKYGPATDEYREYLGVIHDWYAKGYINPDFMSDTQSDTWAMLANNEAGSVIDHTYGYAANYYFVVEESNPDVGLVAAQMPKLNKDDELTHVMVTNRGAANYKTIPFDSEHKMEAIGLLDGLYYDEIEFLFANGIEGEGYNLNEMGYPVITDIESKADATDDQKRGMRLQSWEIAWDYDLDYIITSKYCYGVQPYTVLNYVQCSYDGYYPGTVTFTAEEAEVRADYLTDVETYRDEMMSKFITGDASLDTDWDEYISTIHSIGLDELQDVYAAAYARYLAR